MKNLAILTLTLVGASAGAHAQIDDCGADSFVHGSWVEPSLQPGSLQGALLDTNGAVAYLLDAELTRYVFQGRDSNSESGGVYGGLTAVAGTDASIRVVGSWSRSATGIGNFSALLIRDGEVVMGTLAGQFGLEGLLDTVPTQRPDTQDPDVLGGAARGSAMRMSAAKVNATKLRDFSARQQSVPGIDPGLDDDDGADADGSGHTDPGARQLPGQQLPDVHGGATSDAGGLALADGSAREVSGHDVPDRSGGNGGPGSGLSDLGAAQIPGLQRPSVHAGTGFTARVSARRITGATLADARNQMAPAVDQGALIGSWGICPASR